MCIFQDGSKMDVLVKDTVHIKNRDHVEKVVSQLIKDGASNLQVISDFDHTITKDNQCTFGVIEECPFLPNEYRHQAKLLTDHFYPFESDFRLTKAERTLKLREWYTKGLSLMTQYCIKKHTIPDMVRASDISLRDRCTLVFQQLDEHDVPLLIFSAGVGDVIKEVLIQENMLYPNMKIISNFLTYNNEEIIEGFKGEMIFTTNKTQGSQENSDYFQHLKARGNAILLGDSLTDPDMSEGAENINFILKIGFLNKKIEERLPAYLDAFDVVLTSDSTMDIIIGLLQRILQKTP